MLSKTYRMKTSIKFSLLGGLVGAIVMFGVLMLIEWQLEKHPALDTQVLDYLTEQGYPVDTLGNDMYKFNVDGDKFIFDYFPDDPGYLRIFAGYGVEEYSRADVESVCVAMMRAKKNCMMIPEVREDGMSVRICCESFISNDDALDTDIIDRSIRLIQESEIQLYRRLNHLEE